MPIETTPSSSQSAGISDRSDFYPLEIKPSGSQQATFKDQLIKLRKRAGLYQRALALRTGIDHSSISRLESEDRDPNISTVAVLVEALKPDLLQTLQLIASLAKENDRVYINDLFGLSGNHFDSWRFYALNTCISNAVTPTEKIRDYANRRKRPARRIAEIAGMDHTSISRLLKGERRDVLGTTFVSLVKGLGLTREQTMDLFYSYGAQVKDSAASMPLEAVKQKAL